MFHDTQTAGAEQHAPLPIHPAANIFPMMDAEEFHLLKADIQRHGQREDIIILDGKIIDGRNRYRACIELGIEPFTAQLDECGDPIAFVLSQNLARRHLTKSQAAAIAAEHLPNFVAEAEVRKSMGQKTGGRGHKKTIGKNLPEVSEPTGKAVERAAEVFGVSPETVRQAAKVKEVSPAVHEQVRAGLVTVNAATKRLAAEEKSTPAPKGVTVDGNGVQIPVRLQGVFRRRSDFVALGKRLGCLVSVVEQLAESAAGTILAERLNSIRIDLKNAQQAIKFSAPHQVCPYCKGKGCEAPAGGGKAPCRGTGWTIRGVKGPGK